MIIYNTTYHVDDAIEARFVEYVRQVFIGKALQAEVLSQPRLARIVDHSGERGVSYSLQFNVADVDVLTTWLETHGEMLNEELFSQFGQQVAGFVTLLEEVE